MNIKKFSSRVIVRKCRICETKLLSESKDGLCNACHMELCQDDNCIRCFKIAEALLLFAFRKE